MTRTSAWAWLAGGLALGGCSTSAKQAILETAVDPDAQRKDMFEATLRVLDDNPTYVDEFFVLARKHPITMDRFIAAAARDLRKDDLARLTAGHLVDNPEALHQVLVQTMDAAKDDPAARDAIARAIEDRQAIASDIITDRPSALRASFESMVDAIADKPEARRAFLQSMQATSPELAQLLARNPKTLKAVMKAMLSVALHGSKEDLLALLAEIGGSD